MAVFEAEIQVDEQDAVRSLESVEDAWEGIGDATKETSKTTTKATKKMTTGTKALTKSMNTLGKGAKKTFKSIGKGAKTAGKGIASLTKTMGRAVTSTQAMVAGVVSLGGVITAFYKVLDEGKQLREMSENTGIAIDKLEEFRVMTKLMGGEMDDLSDSVQDFTEKMGEAAFDAESSWADAFESLGVTLDQDVAGAIDDTLLALAKLYDAGRGNEAFFAGVDLFGDTFKRTFASMVRDGVDPFLEKMEKVQQLKTFDAGIVAIQDRFLDMFNELKLQFGGFLIEGVSSAIPRITSAIKGAIKTAGDAFGFDLNDSSKAGEMFGRGIDKGMSAVFAPGGFLSSFIDGFTTVGSTLEKVGLMLTNLFTPSKFKITFEFLGNILKQKLIEGMDFVSEAIARAIHPDKVARDISTLYEDVLRDIEPRGMMANIEKWALGVYEVVPNWYKDLTSGLTDDIVPSDEGLQSLLKKYIKIRQEIAKTSGVESQEYKDISKDIKTINDALVEAVQLRESEKTTTEDMVGAIDAENQELMTQLQLKEELSGVDDKWNARNKKFQDASVAFWANYNAQLAKEKSARDEAGNGSTQTRVNIPSLISPSFFAPSMPSFKGMDTAGLYQKIIWGENYETAEEETESKFSTILGITTTFTNQLTQLWTGIGSLMADNDQKEVDAWKKKEQAKLDSSIVTARRRAQLQEQLDKEQEKREKEAGRRRRASMIAEVWAQTALGIAGVWAQDLKKFGSFGIPMAVATSALLTANAGVQTATIAKQSFNNGGIVEQEAGLPSTGDRHMVRVNPGEEILRRDDPRHSMNNGGGGGVTIQFTGPVYGVDDFNTAVENSMLAIQNNGRFAMDIVS